MAPHPSRKNKNAARVGHPLFIEDRLVEELVDANVARTGFDADDRAAAIDLAGYVMAVVGALGEHLMIGVDAA